MGNFLVFGPVVDARFASLSSLSLDHIDTKLRRKFMRLHRNGANAAQALTTAAGAKGQGGGNVLPQLRSPSASAAAAASTHSLAASSSSAIARPSPALSHSLSLSALTPSPLASAALQGSYGWSMDFSVFSAVFYPAPATGSAAAAAAANLEAAVRDFKLWDHRNEGLVSAMELLTAATLLSSASFEAKVHYLFDLFDFDDSGGLSASELSELMQAAGSAWNIVLGTERGKGFWIEEVAEAAKRAFAHLSVSIPRRRGGAAEKLLASAGARKIYLTSPKGAPYCPAGGVGEVPRDKLMMFCSCVPLILHNICRHNTTDGERMKQYWTRLLHSTSDAALLSGLSESALLRSEALRIRELFASWVPYHRQLLQWHASQRRAQSEALLPPSSSAKALAGLEAAAQASASSPEKMAALDAAEVAAVGLAPGSPIPIGTGSAGKARAVFSPAVLLDEVQSKLTQATQSSQAKDKRAEGVHHTIASSLWRSGSAVAGGVTSQPLSDEAEADAAILSAGLRSSKKKAEAVLDDSLKGLEIQSAANAGTGRNSPSILGSKGGSALNDLGDLRHRPAYLAIKRIKSKVSSRRRKNDPHYSHYTYDKQTLRQAKMMFDSIDRDGSGEIEIAELSGSLEGNPHLGAAISAFKSLDVDQTGSINFAELLRALFPLATLHHVALMCLEVRAIEITRKDIEILQHEFEWMDEDFDGRVLFRDFLERLRIAHAQDQAQLAAAAAAKAAKAAAAKQSQEAKDNGTSGLVGSGATTARGGQHARPGSGAGHHRARPSSGGGSSGSFSKVAAGATEKDSPKPSATPPPPAAAAAAPAIGAASSAAMAAFIASGPPKPATGTGSRENASAKPYARDYVPTRAIYEFQDDRSMSFGECIVELFSRSHQHMIGEIRKWAASMPVPALTDRQHVELEQLFELYDTDGSGSITMDELVAHFTGLGFSEEDNAHMFRMFDRDGGGSVDLVEFKRFYRSVFDTTKIEDYGRGVL